MEQQLIEKLEARLQRVYQNPDKVRKTIQLIDARLNTYDKPAKTMRPLSEKDSILITYGDTITDGDKAGLSILHDFLKSFVQEAIESIHLRQCIRILQMMAFRWWITELLIRNLELS